MGLTAPLKSIFEFGCQKVQFVCGLGFVAREGDMNIVLFYEANGKFTFFK